MKEETKKSGIKYLIVLFTTASVALLLGLIINIPLTTSINASLYNHLPFDNHPWYHAPMEGKTVVWFNGSTLTMSKVIADFYDGCEHNPNQNHSIAVDYVDKLAYVKRVQLDNSYRTRNFTATHELLVWVDASKVERVK